MGWGEEAAFDEPSPAGSPVVSGKTAIPNFEKAGASMTVVRFGPFSECRASLFVMWLAKRVLLVAVAVALATYALDCVGMNTAQQAMQCCDSMPCPSHHHRGQDCCKTMPATRAAFDQPPRVHSVSFSPIACGLARTYDEPGGTESSERMIAEHSHDPPIFYSLPARPLRI